MILGNTANYNKENGIFLSNSDNTTILGNSVVNNSGFGIYLEDSDNNNIVEECIYFNINGAIAISTEDCDDNIIKRNILLSKEGEFIFNNGNNTVINLNYFGSVPPSFIIDVIAQSYSDIEFIIIFNISSETGFGPWEQSIQIWWNGIIVPSNDIIKLGGNLYNVLLTPIFVDPDESPILLNMTISAIHHLEKYFETYITIEPPKLLLVDIINQSFSLKHFNFTFFIFDEDGEGIDPTIIQIWWNGLDVSGDIINLGNGFYFISLDPITVPPGEHPILLSMVISADGYEDKTLEIYITVDPDTLDKGKPAEEFPLTLIIITISSIAGGIGVTSIGVYLLRRRKRVSEVL